MFIHLRLERFKRFRTTQLSFGDLTVLVETNGSGKRTIRDAFRVLHGIGRGDPLAAILAGTTDKDGTRSWTGIRGGAGALTHRQADTCALDVRVAGAADAAGHAPIFTYRIEITVDAAQHIPRIAAEQLLIDEEVLFATLPHPSYAAPQHLLIRMAGSRGTYRTLRVHRQQPILSQLAAHPRVAPFVQTAVRQCLAHFLGMQFIDLDPDRMRRASVPGSTSLGDRGDHLSAVLQHLCESEARKQVLIPWLHAFLPMTIADVTFLPDLAGRIVVALVEANGHQVTAASASDGTLCLLGLLALLLGPEPVPFVWFDDLERSIHPTRLHLLLQLIEQRTAQGNLQVVTTTHAPHLLAASSAQTLEHTVVIYRQPGTQASDALRLHDLPDAHRMITQQSIARLYESGWIEDVLELRDAQGADERQA